VVVLAMGSGQLALGLCCHPTPVLRGFFCSSRCRRRSSER
jgi:hypothetical protein